MPTGRQLSSISHGHNLIGALSKRAHKNWLATEYRQWVYGGWTREDGREVNDPSKILVNFHTACKMLFCSACTGCNKAPKDCRCAKPKTCWAYVGLAPKDETDTFECERHGRIPFRQCLGKSSVFMLSGNQGGKTTAMLSEYCAWVKGRRPWDETLTAPPGSGRIWGLACKSLTKSAALVICPEVEKRLYNEIDKAVYNSAKSISHYNLKNGDSIHIMSYEQYKNAGAFGVNPYEGPRFYAFGWDEPMPAGARGAVLRGLVRARSAGWGREVGAGTPLWSHYILHSIQGEAWNMGGPQRHMHIIGGSIHDNPSLTHEAKQEIMAGWLPEERKAREEGFCLQLAGRVYPTFGEDHIYDDNLFDPLVDKDQPDQASALPIIMACDPHVRRPWALAWMALDEDDEWYVVREWPNEPFERIRSSRYTFDDYAEIIARVEGTIPGGKARVIWREMDPNMGRTPSAGAGFDTVQKAMRDRGVFFRADVSNDIEQGHQAVKQLLAYDSERPLDAINRPTLRVAESCRNTIWSFNNYVHGEWGTDEKSPKEAVKDIGKDFMDVLRYAVMRNPRYRDWRTHRTALSDQVTRLAQTMRASRG